MSHEGLPPDYEKNDALQRSKSDPHEAMAARVGKWKVTTEHAEMFGGQIHVGECTMRMILDGKFMISEGTSNMMGQDCETYGVYSYDSLTEEYVAYNLNSIYTCPCEVRGKMRGDGVIEYVGTMKDAMTPDGRQYRVEESEQSADQFTIDIFDGGEQEFKVLSMKFERKN